MCSVKSTYSHELDDQCEPFDFLILEGLSQNLMILEQRLAFQYVQEREKHVKE